MRTTGVRSSRRWAAGIGCCLFGAALLPPPQDATAARADLDTRLPYADEWQAFMMVANVTVELDVVVLNGERLPSRRELIRALRQLDASRDGETPLLVRVETEKNVPAGELVDLLFRIREAGLDKLTLALGEEAFDYQLEPRETWSRARPE